MALELIRHSDSRLDRSQLVRFMNSYQSVAPLTIGELWAWPSILKLALIENLRRLAEEILDARESRIAADATIAECETRAPPSALPPSPTRPSSSACCSGCANTACTCRRCTTTIEEHLRRARDDRRRRDPRRAPAAGGRAGVDRQRADQPASVLDAQLERLLRGGQPRRAGAAARSGRRLRRDGLPEPRPLSGRPSKSSPRRPARRRCASRCARSRARARRPKPASMTDRAAHVGYHLVGDGRRDLETDIGYRPTSAEAAPAAHAADGPRRSTSGRSACITALLVALGLFYVRAHGGSRRRPLLDRAAAARARQRSRASSFMQRLVALPHPPRRLLRLDFKDGLPPHARTMVIVPVAADDGRGGRGTARAARGHRRSANTDPHIHFAILSDFAGRAQPRDARTTTRCSTRPRVGHRRAERRCSRGRARAASSCSIASGGGTRATQIWMGWERKRGKIEEFNRAAARRDGHELRGAGRRDSSVLPSMRYCLTLDSDTRLPRDAAQQARRHHRASARTSREIDPAIAARHPRLRHPAAARQRDDGERRRLAVRAHLRRAHRRRPVHDRRVRPLSGSLRRRRSSPARASTTSTRSWRRSTNRVPENAVLSHDLFEGLYARTALVSDIEVVDDYPSSVLAHARRQHRWVRGRLADPAVALPVRADARGPGAQPAAAHLALEDPRQPATQPGGARHRRCLLLPAGRRCPAVRRSGRSPTLGGADILRRRSGSSRPSPARGRGSRGACCCATSSTTRRPRWRARRLQLVVPRLPGVADDARHRRDARPRRRDASQDARVADRPRATQRLRHRRGSGARAVRRADGRAARALAAAALVRRRDRAPARAAGGRCRCCCCGPSAPFVAYAAQPAGRPAAARDPRRPTTQFLRLLARKTWRYFDTFVGAARPLAAARQLPGDAATDRRAPHVAHQHRHGPARDARGRTISGFIGTAELVDAHRRHADHDRGHRTLRGPPLQLVRLAEPRAARRRATCRPWTAATSRLRC